MQILAVGCRMFPREFPRNHGFPWRFPGSLRVPVGTSSLTAGFDGYPLFNRGFLWAPAVPTVREDVDGILWELQIVLVEPRGFPPFPRESDGVPAGNR